MATTAEVTRYWHTAPQDAVELKNQAANELTSVIASVHAPLGQVESLIHDQLLSQHRSVQELLQIARNLGGKRLRPALVLLSANAIGEVNEETIRVAAAIELVHTATLIHDDILDGATMRRHRPSLHCQSNIHDGILIGDWLFTQAYALVNEGDSTIPGRWIARAAKEVCEGEIRQNLSVGNVALSLEDYLSQLGQKTGSLCAISCRLGAWSAGGDEATCQAFYNFGWKLGTAFQVHNDWLDYWGSKKRLGKDTGSDFAAGKLTLPLIHLLDRVNEFERMQLVADLRLHDRESLVRVMNLLERYEVNGFCRDAARKLSLEAIDDLKGHCHTARRLPLERLAIAAVERDV